MGQSEIVESGVEVKPLSRSSRIAGRLTWSKRGSVTFSEAARAEATDEIEGSESFPASPIMVEVIDDDAPGEIKTIAVNWRFEFECLSRQPGSND